MAGLALPPQVFLNRYIPLATHETLKNLFVLFRNAAPQPFQLLSALLAQLEGGGQLGVV